MAVPDYDVALLRLEKPLVFDEAVSAICLPGSMSLEGAHASFTKWGEGDADYNSYTVDRIMEAPV